MPTKGQETRNHILKESRKLFTLQGFGNTSINEIIAATGVKKGNLYYHFPSKEELGLAVLTDTRDEFFTILESSFTGDTPVAKIINSCNFIMAMMQQTNFVGGCLFGNTALEMTDSNPGFGTIIQEVFSHWIVRIEEELRLAAQSGMLQNQLPPHTLATAIVATLEGGIMLSRVFRTRHELEACILSIRTLINLQE